MKRPVCFVAGNDNLCVAKWSNGYAFRNCARCRFFPIPLCENCMYGQWHGIHLYCELQAKRSGFIRWLPQSRGIRKERSYTACRDYRRWEEAE
ncbi:MAG: hypothetical protein QXU09_03680 [Thermoproteota archaeon]